MAKNEAEEPKVELCRFLVLAGKHYEGYDEHGNQIQYKTGDIVLSKSNLLNMNGGKRSRGTQKFELISGDVSVYKKVNKRTNARMPDSHYAPAPKLPPLPEKSK